MSRPTTPSSTREDVTIVDNAAVGHLHGRRKMSDCSTCDRCAEGPLAVYEDDPQYDGWICAKCIDEVDRALDAAATAIEQAYKTTPSSWRAIAEAAVNAYFKQEDES